MKVKNGKPRQTEDERRSERCEFESESGSLGHVSSSCGEFGAYQIGVSGENCDQSNTVVAGESALSGISGKISSQLINETEKHLAYHEQQLAYHTQQAEALKKQLQELRQISISSIGDE